MNTVHFGYSEDTQVKTNHGWKAIKDVDLQEDKILSLNPDTFEMEYTVAENRLNRVAKEPFIKLAKNAIDFWLPMSRNCLCEKQIRAGRGNCWRQGKSSSLITSR